MAKKERILRVPKLSIHPKQYSRQVEEQYRPAEVKRLTAEFNQKEKILKEQAVALTPLEFFETIFPWGAFEEYRQPASGEDESVVVPATDGKPNGMITILDDLGSRGWKHNRIVFEDRDEVQAVQGAKFAVTSPVAFSGHQRNQKNAYLVYGLAIDLDNVGPNELRNLLGQMEHGHLPPATMLVNSGTGLHVYYVFDTPIPAIAKYVKPLDRLKQGLADRVWNQYTSRDTEKQYQGIFQGYRIPGTQTKFSKKCLVAAYATGDKISIKDLDAWVDRMYGDTKHSSHISDGGEHISLAQAKELYPDWYKARIEEGKLAGVYELTDAMKHRRRAWYNAWIERIKTQAVCGHRYFCITILFVYASKAQIPLDEAMADALALVPWLDTLSVAGNPFTADDVRDASKFYDPAYNRVGIDKIYQMTGIKIEKTKRNGRTLSAHLKRARLDRDEKYEALGYDWRTQSRDSGIERKVFLYLYEHEGEKLKTVDIAEALGVTRQSVAKYRKLYTPEKAEEYLKPEPKKTVQHSTPIQDQAAVPEQVSREDTGAVSIPEPEDFAPVAAEPQELSFEEFFESVVRKEELTDADRQRIDKEDIAQLVEVERKVLGLCERMSVGGVRINGKLLKEICNKQQAIMDECQKSMTYNPNAPKQIKTYFKDKGVELEDTQEATLRALRLSVPPQIGREIANLLRYREAHTLYIEGKSILDRLDENSRVHPVIDSLGTSTGRLSMSQPNLQGVPSGSLRRCIVPDEDHVFVGADYSQLELRLLANLAKDEVLIRDIKTGDPHMATARTIFNTENPTLEQRESAKTVNYAIVYGKGANGLSADLKITRDEAAELIDNFYDRYKTTKAFLDTIEKELKAGEYAVSWYGRKKAYPEIREYHSRQSWGRRNALIRSAKNFSMQASAADVAKIAMVLLDEAFEMNGLDARIVLQVHDEIIVSCPADEKSFVADLMQICMRDQFSIDDGFEVPLDVKIKVGKTYGEMKNI